MAKKSNIDKAEEAAAIFSLVAPLFIQLIGAIKGVKKAPTAKKK
jgi:hypothetical protein